MSTGREKGGVSVLLELLLRTRVFLLTQPATYQTLSSQSGKYGISTRHFASSLRVLNISRTSSFLFSSQVVLWWCSHIISIQRKYLSLSFISPRSFCTGIRSDKFQRGGYRMDIVINTALHKKPIGIPGVVGLRGRTQPLARKDQALYKAS